MERRCETCSAPMKGRVCKICNAGDGKEKKYSDPRNGLCNYQHQGEYCQLTGSASFEIAGDHPKYFCSYHLFCDSPVQGKKIIDWGSRHIAQILKHRRHPVKFDHVKNLQEFDV